MKRDARIGLAVVLVLGLAVTLLIGRAIYRQGPGANSEGEEVATGTGAAPDSSDVTRVDGVADAASPAMATVTTLNPSEVGFRKPEPINPAVQRFIVDQSPSNKPMPSVEVPPGFAITVDSNAGHTAANTNGPDNGTAPNPPTPHLDDGRLDHEQAAPLVPNGNNSGEKQSQMDGFAYTVLAGDSMWKISSKVFGDGKFTQKIVEANPGMNAQKLKSGSIIRIPLIPNKTLLMKLPSFADGGKGMGAPLQEKTTGTSPTAGPVTAEKHVTAPEKTFDAELQSTTHKVESGESLSVIAKKYYGVSGPKTIARIVAANHGLDPAKLKAGQELTIPGKK